MTPEETSQRISQLCAAVIRLDARCDALEMVISVLAGQVGVEPAKVFRMIDAAREQRHQELLAAVEDKNPALAASLDFRSKPMPDLFDPR